MLFSAAPFFFARNSIRILLNKKQRKTQRAILGASTAIALADVIGLSSMTPVLMLAIDKSFLEKSSKLRFLYKLGNFHSEADFLIALLLFIFLFFLLKSIAALMLYKFTRTHAIQVAEDLSKRSFNKVFQSQFIPDQGLQSDLFEKVVFNPHYYVTGILIPYITMVSEITVVASLTLVFTVYKPGLVLLIAGLLGTAFYSINRYTRNKISKLGEESAHFRTKVLGVLNLGFNGWVDIKSYRAIDFFRNKYGEFYHRYLRSIVKAVSYQLIPSRINELVALMGIIILVIYGYFISDNIAEVRVMAALFVIAVFRLLPAANRLLQSVMHIKTYQYTLNDLVQEKDVENNLENTHINSYPENQHSFGDIQLQGIYFKYLGSENYVFENAELQIPSGKIVGIKGKSGAGKSTLIKLLLGFVNPEKGKIKLNNKPINNGELVSQCSLVSQEPYLFPGSILENVAFGISADKIDHQKAEHALMKAAFHLDIPQNEWLNYLVEANGENLSGGQKQRISLARALYKDNPWLVLDEPTSALDSETEELVIQTLHQWKEEGKSILIIAHRERILNLCDVIFEIKNKNIYPV